MLNVPSLLSKPKISWGFLALSGWSSPTWTLPVWTQDCWLNSDLRQADLYWLAYKYVFFYHFSFVFWGWSLQIAFSQSLAKSFLWIVSQQPWQTKRRQRERRELSLSSLPMFQTIFLVLPLFSCWPFYERWEKDTAQRGRGGTMDRKPESLIHF